MGAKWDKRIQESAFRCKARIRGYEPCGQKRVFSSIIEDIVVNTIKEIPIPDNIERIVEQALRNDEECKEAFVEVDKLEEQLGRYNDMYSKGNINPEKYFHETDKTKQLIHSNYPIKKDLIEQAIHLIQHFTTYWTKCENLENPIEAKNQLLSKIVRRIFVKDDQIMAIAFHSPFSKLIGQYPIQIHEIPAVLGSQTQTSTQLSARNQCGSDEI